jgi:hypothetical protein
MEQGNINCATRLYNIGLIAEKKIDIADDIYVRVLGEKLDNGEYTDNVYNAFRYLVSKSDIGAVDYHNLPIKRNTWNVGKIITEQKTTFQYMQELCRQSFVAGWTGRDGTINLDAFREQPEQDDALVLHDDNLIIAGSIREFKRTEISRVYNEFTIKYDYNSATEKYDGCYSVINVDEPVFPDESGEWRVWVTGIENYAESKRLWNYCRSGYLKNKRIGLAPVDLTELSWFNDLSAFYGQDLDQETESAWLNLLNRAQWSTQQLYQVKYDIPILPETVVLDIMQRVRLSDPIITPTGYGVGWITSLQVIEQEAVIEIELTFEKFSQRSTGSIFCPNIIETGVDTDIDITETGIGSGDINIVEDVNCQDVAPNDQ